MFFRYSQLYGWDRFDRFWGFHSATCAPASPTAIRVDPRPIWCPAVNCGALWMTFSGQEAHLNAVLTHLYSLFSHVLWPLYIPIAILLLEPVLWRRWLISGVAVAGAATAVFLLYFLVMEPTVSRVVGMHIEYVSPHFYTQTVLPFYVLATCASSLLSSHSAVRWFGMATAGSLLLAAAVYTTWFISVWCFFAAAISVIVLLYFVQRPSSQDASALDASGLVA